MPPPGPPRLVLVLSENDTLTGGRDLRTVVHWAREAEDAGFDAVMVSEHVVLGRSADADGRMANPREYALPGNQDPATPWPSSLVLLSAMAAVTERIRLAAAAVITPLRHPLLLAKDFATLDLLSEGRLVVLPTVSWHRDEYVALGVPFEERGARLDEQLELWEQIWRGSPVSFHGRFYDVDDVWVQPGPVRHDGPRMWFGGSTLHDPLLRRLVRWGHGWNPLGRPSPADTDRLGAALAAAGRAPDALELVGGVRARFPDDRSVANLAEALESLPEQMAQGFTSFCVKPSQFVDDADAVGAFCREAVARTAALTG